jgi:predicted transcriptional regulator
MESSNTSQSIIYLIRKAHLMEAKQADKQGKKKYTVTQLGIEFIEKSLKANAKDKE